MSERQLLKLLAGSLLTGFLGSGKTTLLNRILNGQHGLRVGVLVNDFGAINIDAELVDGVEENTIRLTNGCVCCEIRDDLVNSLEQLLTRVDAIDYVILEASGLAEPEGIMIHLPSRLCAKWYARNFRRPFTAAKASSLQPSHLTSGSHFRLSDVARRYPNSMSGAIGRGAHRSSPSVHRSMRRS